MKCYVCNYENDVFGKIEASGGEWTSLIGSMPRNVNYGYLTHGIGSVEIHVCPNCGALHSDMRNEIVQQDRKS